jgi:hypothetical protein
MSLSTKILIWLGGIVLVGALGFIIFKQIENSNRQLAIESQMVEQKQLIDGIVRSQSQWTTKADLEKYITDSGVNLKAIKDDLEKLHAEVNAVNVIVASSQGQHGTNIPSTGPGPTNPNPVDPKNPDPYGYMKAQQNLALNEDFGTLKVPVGTVGFSAWQEKPWNIDIKARDYQVATVVGLDENQRSYFYNKFTVKVDDKVYDIPIKTAVTKQEFPEAKWSWWNPRLFIGVDGGVGLTPVRGEFTPSLDVGIMSYGRYKTQPDFSVLQVGAGYGTISQRPQLVITPVMYNVGKSIPLMNNAYIGPSVHIGTDGNVGLMGGLRVAL